MHRAQYVPKKANQKSQRPLHEWYSRSSSLFLRVIIVKNDGKIGSPTKLETGSN